MVGGVRPASLPNPILATSQWQLAAAASLLTALHTRSNGPRRQRALRYRGGSNIKTSTDLRARIGRLATAWNWLKLLLPVSRVTIHSIHARDMFDNNGRTIFDKCVAQRQGGTNEQASSPFRR